MKTKIGLLGLVMSFLFVGCSKDDQTDTPMTADDLTVNAYMDEMSDDVSKIALDQYTRASTSLGKTAELMAFLPDCATVSFSDTQDTWVRTIDFDAKGCVMKNGNTLKGKITISGSNNYQQSIYSINCSFDNFYHNGNLIQGGYTIVRSIKSTPNLQSDHPVLEMNADLKVTTVNGVIRNITTTRIREMVDGLDTPTTWMDDVYLISGNQSITSPKGTMSSAITTPLKLSMNCNHIVEGVIEFTKKNNKTATLDYGDGACDKTATCTINGVVKTIVLGNN